MNSISKIKVHIETDMYADVESIRRKFSEMGKVIPYHFVMDNQYSLTYPDAYKRDGVLYKGIDPAQKSSMDRGYKGIHIMIVTNKRRILSDKQIKSLSKFLIKTMKSYRLDRLDILGLEYLNRDTIQALKLLHKYKRG